MSKGLKKYTKAVTTRFPDSVFAKMEEAVKDKQVDYPRYTEGDLLRAAAVNYLKLKGYLDKDKNYL